MKKGQKETLSVRVISCAFIVLALAIFKSFGLEAWEWYAYFHLFALFLLGMLSCMMTESILKYILRKPRSYERGVNYIIRRNLWFQLINTPLVSLLICLYRHYVMSDFRGMQIPSNILSWSNYFETLAIIAFCSFAIGLYWRFKFRSRYLEAELEETRQLNEQLKKLQEAVPILSPVPDSSPIEELSAAPQSQHIEEDTIGQPSVAVAEPAIPTGKITLSGTTNERVTLQISLLLYIEAVGNYVKVCQLRDGQVRSDMLRATSKQMEDDLRAYPMIVRCHRAFLVNLQQVEQIVSKSGSMQLLIRHSHDYIPVSRSNMSQVKETLFCQR